MSLHGNWIKFKGIPNERGLKRHHVTMNHKGQIHLGRQAHTDLGRPKAVTLYYEPTLNKIAIEPADPRVSGVVPLYEKSHGAYYMSVAYFIRQNRISIAGTETFLKPEINLNGILILDLNETARISYGGRIWPDADGASPFKP